eukprot:XP_011669781.1 PREDICTED: uncharacterized protein LOC105440889 [Strongylocentrotus purpuratus]
MTGESKSNRTRSESQADRRPRRKTKQDAEKAAEILSDECEENSQDLTETIKSAFETLLTDKLFVDKFVTAIREQLILEIHESLCNEVKQSLGFDIESRDARIVALEKEMEQLKAEKMTAIHGDLQDVRGSMDDLEQYSRRNCLIFSGVEEKRGENTTEVIRSLCRQNLGVEVNVADVDRIHRLGPARPNGEPPENDRRPSTSRATTKARNIIVKFSNYEPETVSMFRGQTDSSTSIRLLWRAPSVGLYQGYLVSYSPANGDQSSPIELGPDEEELTITGLQFNQMYNVSIRSIMGQEGTYVESDPAFDMVTTGYGEENEVNIRDLTSTSVSFTWWGTGFVESPIGLIPIGSCMAERPPEQEVTSRAATFDDLTPGARYAISGIGGDNAEFIADITVIEGSKITIIDVSIPFDNGPEACTTAADAKVEKYSVLRQSLREAGNDVEVHGFIRDF